MKIILLMCLIFGIAMFIPGYLKGDCQMTQPEQSSSEKIDELFAYFRWMGTECKVDEKIQSKLFAPDFQMIINGRVIVDGYDHLTPHFELLFGQVSRIDLEIYEKIVTKDKVVMRYDVLKPGKSASKVIAIFKLRDNLVYEMNEVVHSVNPKNEIDFTTK